MCVKRVEDSVTLGPVQVEEWQSNLVEKFLQTGKNEARADCIKNMV